MGWLPGEEVTLVFGALVALGCLTLGVLELLWPTGARRALRRGAVRSTDPSRLVTLVQRARGEHDPDRRITALRVAILTLERWHATRSADDTVTPALERARAELWADYERMARTRLAAATIPWRAGAVEDAAPAAAAR